MRWQPLSPTQHREGGWTRFKDHRHARHDNLVPVAVAELAQLLAHYPLGFSRNKAASEEPHYLLVALLSLQSGLNIYVDVDGQWQAPYVPAHYRGYPFSLRPNQQGQMTLCYDQQSELVHIPALAGDVPLFQSDGQLGDELKGIVDFLKQFYENRRVTQTLVDQLARHQLIQPWKLAGKGEDGQAKTLAGLYTINENALRQLDPEALVKLTKSGALGLAYAQLFSQSRLVDQEARFRQYASRHDAPKTTDFDIGSFVSVDDDMIKFQ